MWLGSRIDSFDVSKKNLLKSLYTIGSSLHDRSNSTSASDIHVLKLSPLVHLCHVNVWRHNVVPSERKKVETHHSELLGCISLPQADVHFVWATHHILVVGRPLDTDHVLHALGVVHLPGATGIQTQYSARNQWENYYWKWGLELKS